MSSPSSTASPDNAPSSHDEAKEEKRELIFFAKLDKDVWEAWVWSAVGLAVCAILIWLVAFLKLGYVSVYAYGVGIPLTMLMTVPIVLWGLFKTMINPPIMRVSRSVGFASLFLVAWAGRQPNLPAPVSTEDFVSSHHYSLPFSGEWYTLSGGLESETNSSITSPALRFAYVFTKLTPDGARFDGDASLLESYPCYGAEVLSPVEGEVVTVYATQQDNVPGVASQDNMLGNHIVLKVDEEEFLIATFLKQNSIPVEVGQKVARGDKIGECGNSGGVAWPQLQVYLVKDGYKLILTEGLPMPFEHYEVVGKRDGAERVVKGMPLGAGDPQLEDLSKGQIVRPYSP